MEVPTEANRFHGTSKEAVAHLLAGDIRPSDQRFEWLCTGFYLWQDSPWRARQWTEERFGSDAAMVIGRYALERGGVPGRAQLHWPQARRMRSR